MKVLDIPLRAFDIAFKVLNISFVVLRRGLIVPEHRKESLAPGGQVA